MTKLVCLVAVATLFGCGDDPKTWQQYVDEFAEAICVNACITPTEQMSCVTDVTNDMADAKSRINDTSEARCIKCMEKKTELTPMVVANSCQSTPALDAQIAEACDLDPATDYDMNGTPNDDYDEACGGAP